MTDRRVIRTAALARVVCHVMPGARITLRSQVLHSIVATPATPLPHGGLITLAQGRCRGCRLHHVPQGNPADR